MKRHIVTVHHEKYKITNYLTFGVKNEDLISLFFIHKMQLIKSGVLRSDGTHSLMPDGAFTP